MAEKVKVKIAVSVNSDGDWCAVGWQDKGIITPLTQRRHEKQMIEATRDEYDLTNAKTYFIEAEIDIPSAEVQTIKCEAIEVGE